MRSRRYGTNRVYHGRRKASTPLVVLIVVLAVLLIAGLAFLLFMGKYIQYTDDGVKLVLPWRQEQESETAPSPDVSDLIITLEPTPSPTPAADASTRVISALEVTAEDITGGRAAELAAQAGADALVVTVKDEKGVLAWSSAVPLAQEDMNGNADFSAAVSDLDAAGDLWLAARLPAFRDLWASVYNKSQALTTGSGKLWYDSGGISWLSAANEDARAYLTSLCTELAELGFDEIVLERAGFPDSGKLSAIAADANYPAAEAREAAVTEFLSGLAEALAEKGVVLSVLASEQDVTAGGDSGLTAGAMAALGRVWLTGSADPSVCAAALTDAGMENARSRLVLTAGAEDWSGSRAALNEG